MRPLGSVLETRDGRSFIAIAQLPVPVRYTSVAERGRTVFVIGGELADGTDTSDIQAVNLSSGRASIAGRLPAGLSHASAVNLRGRVLLLGGRLDGTHHRSDIAVRSPPDPLEAGGVDSPLRCKTPPPERWVAPPT